MSLSEVAPVSVPGQDDYADGWLALNKLLRGGYSWSGRERNRAFANLGQGNFADVSVATGLDVPGDGRALAVVDWDGDGDEDLLLRQRNAPRVRLFLRRGSPARALTLELAAGGANPDAIGARIELLRPEGARLVRSVRAGEGYLAQSSPRITVPLLEPAELWVHWPGGPSESFGRVSEGGTLRLLKGQGTGIAGRERRTSLAEQPWPAIELGPQRRVLANPVPMPGLTVSDPQGKEVALFGPGPDGRFQGTGRPLLIDLWASWCAPCLAQLRNLAGEQGTLRSLGVAPLPLSLDGEADRARAAELLGELSWSGPHAFAKGETPEVLLALVGVLGDDYEPLALPTSLLVDAQGGLRVLYRGPVDAARVLEDVALLEADAAQQLAAAYPWGGTWHGQPGEFDPGPLERGFTARGHPAVAATYARSRIEVRQSSRADLLHDFGRRQVAQGRLDGALSYFQQVLALEPGHFPAQFDLAVVLHQSGELDAAIAEYRKALKLQPEHVDAHFNLGLALLGLGDLEAVSLQIEWLRERNEKLSMLLETQLLQRR